MNAHFVGTFVAFTMFVVQATAQETLSTPPQVVRSAVAAYLRDGSLLNVTALDTNLKLITKYGEQVIEFGDILDVNFGLHYPPGMESKVAGAISLLSSSVYREREDATRILLDGKHFAYPLLKKAAEGKNDLEADQRIKAVLARIKERCPSDLLSVRECDTVRTPEMTLVGRLTGSSLKVRSAHLGDLDLKFTDLKAIKGSGSSSGQELTLDAAKHGSRPDQWSQTSVFVHKGVQLAIKCEGQVDLWPSGPGQYMTTPKGYTTAGKGSTYMAGALVGRIGESGKTFLIGNTYQGAPEEEGMLHLLIVPSPWNNSSTGSYRVHINASAFLSR